MPILFDGKGKKQGQIIGKSPYMHSVVVAASEELIGKIVDIEITEGSPNSLKGFIKASAKG